MGDTARLSQRYPPIARYGVFGVSTWPTGRDTPSPFSKRLPCREHAKWRCDTPPPPPQKGYLSDTCAIPFENKANGCDTPLCDTISKGYCAIWGGISRWAATNLLDLVNLRFHGDVTLAPPLDWTSSSWMFEALLTFTRHGRANSATESQAGVTTGKTSQKAGAFQETPTPSTFSEVSQKNPRAHKNKIGTSTPLPENPNPPPRTPNFMGTGVVQQKEPKNARRPLDWRGHFRPQTCDPDKLQTLRCFLRSIAGTNGRGSAVQLA